MRTLAFLVLLGLALPLPERTATVADPSRFERFDLALPALGVERAVRVYLPRGYADCAGCRFPVLYLMDGQNVFDAATSYAGEWGADETLDALQQRHQLALVAVAIDHGGAARVHELSVWENAAHAPARGDAFLADLVDAVKPAIDARYRTRSGAASTAIAGSSFGGLMAHATMLPQARAVVSAWRATLPDDAALAMHEVAAAGHDEAAWRAALPGALCWLYRLPCEATP